MHYANKQMQLLHYEEVKSRGKKSNFYNGSAGMTLTGQRNSLILMNCEQLTDFNMY